MRHYSYSTKVLVSRIEEEAMSLSILILLLSSLWLTSSLHVASPNHLHVSLSPFHLSVCRCFKAMLSISAGFVAI